MAGPGGGAELLRVPAVCLFPAAVLQGLRHPFPDAAENLTAERWWDAGLAAVHRVGQKAVVIQERPDLPDAGVGRSAGRVPRPADEHRHSADALRHALAYLTQPPEDALAQEPYTPDAARSGE